MTTGSNFGEVKSRSTILSCVIAAAIFDGLLAGGNLDRSLVAMPAWRTVGPVAWAMFSRQADLGNGLLLYPIMAIGGTLLCLIAAVLLILSAHPPRSAHLPIFIGAALMILALPLSMRAAPFMLSIKGISDGNVGLLAQAFAGFEFWGRLQGIFHLGAFTANLWSIVALLRRRELGPIEPKQASRAITRG